MNKKDYAVFWGLGTDFVCVIVFLSSISNMGMLIPTIRPYQARYHMRAGEKKDTVIAFFPDEETRFLAHKRKNLFFRSLFLNS